MSSPGRSDEENEEADKLGEEVDEELLVQGLQGCGERGQNAEAASASPAATDVYYNADKQQLKSISKLICRLSVLTESMCRDYESLFVGCSSALEGVGEGGGT